jgi:lysophospholipase L1-like esterase
MVPPGRRLRRVIPPFLLVAAVALAASGCSATSSAGVPEQDQTGRNPASAPIVSVGSQTDGVVADDRPATVAVVGDSITVASAEQLDEGLSALGLDVVAIDAQVGRRMTVGERDRLYTGADIAALVANQSSPELWVFALGTNDVGQYDDVDEVVEQIEALLGRIPADDPVVWVDTWIRGRPEQTERVNAAIRTVIERRPGSTVVAWSAHAPDTGVISSDGVHLTTEVGVRRFADVVITGVESLIGPAT